MIRNLVLVVSSFLLGVLLVACDSESESPSTNSTSSDPVPLNVQLSWLHNIEFAGLYVALDQGFYTDQDLNVTLHAGGVDAEGNYIDPIQQVASGAADFGVVDATILLDARENGLPLVAIATIYQEHPLALTSLAEKRIRAPQDLRGANVQISGTSRVIYDAFQSAVALNPNLVNEAPRTDFTVAPLLSGEADVIDGWITNEVIVLELEGHNVNTILPSDYGIEAYPNVIFTTEAMIAEHPDRVEKFLRATLNGTEEAIANPDYAVTLSVQQNPELDPDVETEAMQRSLALLNPADSQPGMMESGVWDFMHAMLIEQGILAQALDVEDAYTTQFLDLIYAD